MLHERKLRTTNEVGKKTSTKTSQNMEYRQYCKPSRGNHALHHARYTNKRRAKTNTIPRHQHRKRGRHTRLPMDGGLRTPIFVEKWGYQRKGAAYYPPVSKSFHSWQGPDNRTNER